MRRKISLYILVFVVSFFFFGAPHLFPARALIKCSLQLASDRELVKTSIVTVTLNENTKLCGYSLELDGTQIAPGQYQGGHQFTLGPGLSAGEHTIEAKLGSGAPGCEGCSQKFMIYSGVAGKPCIECQGGYYYHAAHKTCCKIGDTTCTGGTKPVIEHCPGNCGPDGKCVGPPLVAGPVGPGGPCPGLAGVELNKCKHCVDKEGGVWTALGCIPVNPAGFVSWLLQKVIGLAGGIAFLLILYGGFQILTSTGDPEKLASGKDIIVGALAGLLMIIFSVLLLRIIGYDILQIPGFITK